MKKLVLIFIVGITIAILVQNLSVESKSTCSDLDLIPDNYVAVFVWDNFIKYNERYNSKIVKRLFDGYEFRQFFVKNIMPAEAIDSYSRLINLYKIFYEKLSVYFNFNSRLTFLIINDSSSGCKQYEYVAIVNNDDFKESYNVAADNLFKIDNLYRNYVIYNLKFNNSYYLTILKNKIIIGTSEKIVRKCIDKFLQNKINLRLVAAGSNDDDRLKLFFNKEFDFSCWLSGEYLKSIDRSAAIFSLIDKYIPVHSFGFSHYLGLNGNKIDASFTTSSDNIVNKSIDSATRFTENNFYRKSMMFLWTNRFSMSDFISIFDDVVDRVLDLNNINEKFFTFCGENECDEIINSFGNEFCLLINGNSVPHQYDDSVGCLVFEIIDSKIVLNFLKKILTGIQSVTIKAGDLDITSLSLAGGLLRPSYCLKGKYLFIADNAELIENAWNNYYSQYGRFNMITGEGNYFVNNFFVYSRVGDMSNRLYPLINLFVKDNGEWANMLSQQNRAFFRGVGLPLLTALRNIDNGSLRIYISPHDINFHISYLLKNN